MESLDTLADLFRRPQFHAGLLSGLAVWLVVYTVSPKRHGWGVALGAATIIGVHVSVDQRLGTATGLIILAIGGALLSRMRRSSQDLLPWLTIGVGAIVTTVRGGLPGTTWIQFAAPVLIVGFGYWMSVWENLPQRRLLGPLVAITAFGIWSTVPDTDTARVLLGAAIPLMFATVSSAGLRLSAAGAFPLAGIVVWVAATGGEARHASIVGAWACIGILLILPLLRSRAAQIRPGVILASHALLVVVSARLFGLWEDALFASLGVLMTAGVGYLVLKTIADQVHASKSTL